MSFKGSKWYDMSGNGNDANILDHKAKPIKRVCSSGNGATGSVDTLQGTTTSKIKFGRVIKRYFTICSLTRYNGNNRGRILRSENGNFLHGHHGSRAGVAYYETWRTKEISFVPVDDWVVMCGTNEDDKNRIMRANGKDVPAGDSITGGEGDKDLSVHVGEFHDQPSDWEISEVITWDRF